MEETEVLEPEAERVVLRLIFQPVEPRESVALAAAPEPMRVPVGEAEPDLVERSS